MPVTQRTSTRQHVNYRARAQSQGGRYSTQEEVEGSVAYTDLVKILLDFQLRGHDRFLMRFRELFQSIDSDGAAPK